MPTPFTHLASAQRMLHDAALPADLRDTLTAECPAFLLGSIAADARNSGDLKREDTHFYSYDQGIHDHPWRVMLGRFPQLWQPSSPAQRAFLLGYVGHLSMDERWSLDMLGPHFAQREWGTRTFRFLMLHILLIYMDERDQQALEGWQAGTLLRADPQAWTPFMTDLILRDWRDFIGAQILPGGASQTLAVFGGRINKQPEELRAILDVPQRMQTDLWDNIAPDVLAEVEAGMYAHAVQQMTLFWETMRSS